MNWFQRAKISVLGSNWNGSNLQPPGNLFSSTKDEFTYTPWTPSQTESILSHVKHIPLAHQRFWLEKYQVIVQKFFPYVLRTHDVEQIKCQNCSLHPSIAFTFEPKYGRTGFHSQTTKYVVDSCIQCGLCHVQCQMNNNLMTVFDVCKQSLSLMFGTHLHLCK